MAIKLEKGDYKGAVRLACSEDSVAVLNEEAIAALKLPFSTPRHMYSSSSRTLHPRSLSEEEVARAICAFPNGSAGGSDGLPLQHLKDLISASVERGGRELLTTLTNFLTIIKLHS